MTRLENSFDGINSGTNITNVNQTGGASGNQFDSLILTGTGVSLQVNTSADMTGAFTKGCIANLNSQSNGEAALEWNHPAVSTSYHRLYYRTPASVNPCVS